MDKAADESLVAFVGWVDSDGGITEDGFGASGGNDDFRDVLVWVIIGAFVGAEAS